MIALCNLGITTRDHGGPTPIEYSQLDFPLIQLLGVHATSQSPQARPSQNESKTTSPPTSLAPPCIALLATHPIASPISIGTSGGSQQKTINECLAFVQAFGQLDTERFLGVDLADEHIVLANELAVFGLPHRQDGLLDLSPVLRCPKIHKPIQLTPSAGWATALLLAVGDDG